MDSGAVLGIATMLQNGINAVDEEDARESEEESVPESEPESEQTEESEDGNNNADSPSIENTKRKWEELKRRNMFLLNQPAESDPSDVDMDPLPVKRTAVPLVIASDDDE